MLRNNKNKKSVRSLRARLGWQVLVLAVALMSISGVASAAKGGNGKGGGGDKGGGNGGNVGGDVSGWIFIDVLFDDDYLNDPINGSKAASRNKLYNYFFLGLIR